MALNPVIQKVFGKEIKEMQRRIRLQKAKAVEASEILDRIFTEGFEDDHNTTPKPVQIPTVVLLRYGYNGIDVCFSVEDTQHFPFTVNPFYIGGKGLRLSKGSVGGVVHMENFETLEDAVNDYNTQYKDERLAVVRAT